MAALLKDQLSGTFYEKTRETMDTKLIFENLCKMIETLDEKRKTLDIKSKNAEYVTNFYTTTDEFS